MKKSKSAFTKDDLLHTIMKHTKAPLFYVSGYDGMREYCSSRDNLDRIAEFIRKNGIVQNEKEFDIIFVCFNTSLKRYYLESSLSKEYIYIYNNSRHNLKNIGRFLKKTCSLDDVQECGVCFDKIRNDLSSPLFNALTYTCERCFNTICISCYIKMQEESKYTCCFCKMENTVAKKVEVVSSLNKYFYVDREVYNRVIMKVDDLSKNNVCETDLKQELSINFKMI